jgi:hypothetical protein
MRQGHAGIIESLPYIVIVAFVGSFVKQSRCCYFYFLCVVVGFPSSHIHACMSRFGNEVIKHLHSISLSLSFSLSSTKQVPYMHECLDWDMK